MKILEIADNNVKIFGWTILKIKFKRGKTKFYQRYCGGIQKYENLPAKSETFGIFGDQSI